jgi:hypothetical protein
MNQHFLFSSLLISNNQVFSRPLTNRTHKSFFILFLTAQINIFEKFSRMSKHTTIEVDSPVFLNFIQRKLF